MRRTLEIAIWCHIRKVSLKGRGKELEDHPLKRSKLMECYHSHFILKTGEIKGEGKNEERDEKGKESPDIPPSKGYSTLREYHSASGVISGEFIH